MSRAQSILISASILILAAAILISTREGILAPAGCILLVVAFCLWVGGLVFVLTDTVGHRYDSDTLTCSHCGYNLTGNVSGTCPECGTPMPGYKAKRRR